MKKRILLSILLIVGCDNSTEPQDCAGVVNGSATTDDCGVCDSDATNDCAVGSYTLTTSLSYNASDCSGQEEESSEFIENGGSIIIELNADGIVEVNMLAGETTELLTGIWTQNNNNVSIIMDSYTNHEGEEIYGASETFTFIDKQLIIYSYGTDGIGHGWISTVLPCTYMVFTKN